MKVVPTDTGLGLPAELTSFVGRRREIAGSSCGPTFGW
jgi:hypothetical protein